ncbi:glycosyltransferase family 2 protein, partial [Arsukibacterium sp.]|uniref:glycosyltransferase family 2 protein n=1 Tax=Arsukibacterium sp. TaxID=1977258 RepID=UPI003568E421
MNKLTTQSIKISVLIATRNRPEEFLTALNSVLAQSYPNIEVIVVNDGSDEEHLTHYHVIENNNNSRVKFIYLPKRPNGHGPSFARNTAAQNASGDFLAFLDDDDIWNDSSHLERFIQACYAANELELYFTNQKAVKADGTLVTTPLWLESLRDSAKNQLPIMASTVKASVEWLLSARGFAHLNCTIVKSKLFKQVGGFDESLRYEEDKDLYWRLVDTA